jgi:hypothetical protein
MEYLNMAWFDPHPSMKRIHHSTVRASRIIVELYSLTFHIEAVPALPQTGIPEETIASPTKISLNRDERFAPQTHNESSLTTIQNEMRT